MNGIGKSALQSCGWLLLALSLFFGLGWLLLLVVFPPLGCLTGLIWLVVGVILVRVGVWLVQGANWGSFAAGRPLRVPPVWALGWGLLLVLIAGEAIRRQPGFFGTLLFLPLFFMAAALPPLAAIAWVSGDASEDLTWRGFAFAFVGGATVSVGLAVLLEMLLPALIFALVQGLFEVARGAWERLVTLLADGEVARALGSYTFWLALIQLAVIAPLVEEFVKPLVAWPLLRRAPNRRQVFLLGAVAGAGFAALENLLYTGFGLSVWGGVVVVRVLGAAIHPLGAGLVALAWHDVLGRNGLFHPARRWLVHFGLAAGVHALWNGGSLVLLALVGANFFGPSPPEVDVLGVTLAGVLLALLALIGGGAWVGLRVVLRSLGEGRPTMAVPGPTLAQRNRALAVWGVLCLLVSLSIGLAALSALGSGG